MRPRFFLAVSWLAMLPGTFAYANLGAEFSRLEVREAIMSPMQLVSPFVFWSLTIAGLTALVAGWLAARPAD